VNLPGFGPLPTHEISSSKAGLKAKLASCSNDIPSNEVTCSYRIVVPISQRLDVFGVEKTVEAIHRLCAMQTPDSGGRHVSCGL
jgi:hypothetical protein